ncbi:helix-turn-helix transcriptional regulator [Planctomycetota bacterium]|nr:helix-turn-helix transcriptional regulator [Planctomycetota bacterium]
MKQSIEAISSNLKAYRESRGLSLDQLSALTDVSKSMLRQIENGKSSPTIATLWKIANGLKVSFSGLLAKPAIEAEVKSFCEGEPLVEKEGHYRLYPIIPFDPSQSFESYYFEIDPGTEYMGEPHEGNTYEYVFVHAGVLEIQVGGKEHKIEAGHFLKFLANNPHRYRCTSDESVRAIMQVCYSL